MFLLRPPSVIRIAGPQKKAKTNVRIQYIIVHAHKHLELGIEYFLTVCQYLHGASVSVVAAADVSARSSLAVSYASELVEWEVSVVEIPSRIIGNISALVNKANLGDQNRYYVKQNIVLLFSLWNQISWLNECLTIDFSKVYLCHVHQGKNLIAFIYSMAIRLPLNKYFKQASLVYSLLLC